MHCRALASHILVTETMLRGGKDRKYAFILLIAAAAVLAIGLVLKPSQPEPKSPPSETELAQLQRLTQQRRLRDLSYYLNDAADNAASPLVFVRQSEQSGVIWDSRALIVTTKTAPGVDIDRPWTAVTSDGQSVPLTAVPLQSGAPFAAFSLHLPPRTAVAIRTSRPPDLGDWVLAVARNSDGGVVFAHGLYQGMVAAHCGAFAYRSVQSSAPLSAALLGGGMFTIEGQFLGLISECDQIPTVIAANTIAEVLRQPPSVNSRLEDYYGIRVADGSAAADKRPVSATVQVVALWAGSRGEQAGLRPGDLIVAADGQPVHSRADLEALVAPEKTDHQLTIQRQRRQISVVLPADTVVQSGPTSYGLTLSERLPARQVVVASVAPGSDAERAGIKRGDLLLRVGIKPVSSADAAFRAIQDAKTEQLLALERDGSRYEVLVAP
jgi:serine protease DegQ